MDRTNLGQGVSASSEKLSGPRFRKQRKPSSTSRARPATSAWDDRDGHGFYPFSSGMPHAAPLDRGEDSGTHFVQEQFYGWKPFGADASTCSSPGTGFVFSSGSSGSNVRSINIGAGSVKGTAFNFGNNCSGKFGTRVFSYGSGTEKVSSLSSNLSQSSSAQSLGSADSAKSEATESILCTGSFYDSNVKIDQTGMPVGGSVCSIAGGNTYSGAGVGVFGRSDEKNGNLCHNSSLGCDNDSFYKMNSRKNANEKTGKLDSFFSVHSSGEKKNTHSGKNSFASDDGLPGEQTNITRKSDLENSGNVDSQNLNMGVNVFGSFGETKINLDQSSTISFNECSFSSVSKLPDDLRKLKIDASGNGENGKKDPGVYVFGSGVNKNKCASKGSSFDSIDGPFSKLPEKMEKLNLQSSSGEAHLHAEPGVSESCLKKHVQFDQASSSGLDDEGFSKFSGELKKQNLQSLGNEDHGNDNHGVFRFSSDVRKNGNSGKSSSLNFDESSISKLHDEIGKMKLNSSGKEDDSQKGKPGNTWGQHENNSGSISSNFTLHSGKEDYGSRVTPLQAHNSHGLSAETASSPSPLPGFQSSAANFCFTSMHTVSETPGMEFRSQKQDTSLLTKENLVTGTHRNIPFGMKKEDSKGARLKKKRGKARQSAPVHSGTAKQFVSMDEGTEENGEQDSTGGYSPMDYSPYQETLVSNQCSREASVASDESIHLESRYTSNVSQKSSFVGGKEGELFSTTENFDTKEGLLENEVADSGFRVPSSRHFSSESSCADEMTSGLRKGSHEAKSENAESSIQMNSSSMEAESFSYGSSIKQPTYEDGSGFTFTSCSQDRQDDGQSNFLFSATSSVQGPSSAPKRSYRRKIRVKGVHESHSNSKVSLASPPSNLSQFPNAYVPTNPKQEQKGSNDGERVGKIYCAKANQESPEETCEKWRLRGNQHYAVGNLSKAEDYYSRGVDSLSLKEISKSCNRTLMLCYSNRAATRMSLGRLREALSDCKMAVAIDPSFLRARVRAGNIHLSLGESADALQYFEKVLQLDKVAKFDQKILSEAVDGLKKTQNLNDLTDQSSILLTKRTPDDATKALEIISEALSIGPYSEILLEMKAEALVKLRNYEEAIQICEQTLELAEKNADVTEPDYQLKDNGFSKSMERSYVNLWRWRIISKCYFYLGRLEDANELLQKHENVKPVVDKYWSRYPESSTSFPVTVCELLRLKTAGNEAFQAGRHLEAVELYTAALALNTESRPFTAIYFCNRAAAYQALGQVTDAIADCSLAIALDSSYRKAISRRATLHEMIRDYGQAATDLHKLISLLEMSSEDKNSAGGALGRSNSNITDLNQALKRLCTVEEEDRKGGTLDMYIILGIEKSSSATDVRKAYRKAALRHHPDKAGQFLARSENGDDSVWREVAEEVHTNADRLFKMIGEAYTILGDPSKRLQYDTEEELRTMKKGYEPYGGSCSPKTPASSYNSQYERRTDSRHWRPTYGSTHRR